MLYLVGKIMPVQTKTKIIVMEDDMAMAEIVSHKLESKGFSVRHAPDGAQGWEMVQKEPPDLVLLDLMMPEMDGFQVLEKIRDNADEKIKNLPVIVLSNLWSNQDILKTQALRADEYMVKAYFTPDDILAKIEEVLKKHNN
jgi:DNA-binding response OmpR family regulator